MPRVSDEYREARRDEIARAAIRCLERRGVRDTSIADIVKESGLSTGAIYSHFSNKAQLARYIVGRYVFTRIMKLDADVAAGVVIAPREVLRRMLGGVVENGISPRLILQFWGEAMVDPDIGEELTRTVTTLRQSLATAVTPWVRAHPVDDAGSDEERIESAVRSITALAQGYIANSAVFGPRDLEEYLRGIDAALTV